MKFSQNGHDFTNEDSMVEYINKYAGRKGVNVTAFLATQQSTGSKAYVLFDKSTGKPIYSSPRMEEIGVHIDVLAMI